MEVFYELLFFLRVFIRIFNEPVGPEYNDYKGSDP